MNNLNVKTPVGLKDYLLKDMEKKNKIETVLKELFLNSGYNLIETPTLEYADVFTKNMQDQSLYKLINIVISFTTFWGFSSSTKLLYILVRRLSPKFLETSFQPFISC